MKLSESAQELLELLWIAAEEEAKAGLVMEGTPLEGVDELVRLDLAEWNGEGLTLTAGGRPEAAQAGRRHRLAVLRGHPHAGCLNGPERSASCP